MKQEFILKGVLLYSISTWVNLVLGFLTVTITTRVLLPDVYGQVSIFNSITSVLMYILLLGMDGAYVRYYNELPANDTRSQLLYKNLLYTTLFCLLVGSITVCFLGEEVSKFFFNICSKILVGYIFIYTLCQMALRYLNISFRMSFRITQYNIQNILMNNIFRLLLIVTALFTNNLEYIIAILSLGMLFVLVVYLYVQRKEFIPVNIKGKLDYRVSLHGYNSYFRFALFSAPTYIIFYFNGYMSQQIVMTSLGAYAFGIFSSTNMFSQLLGAMQGGFSTFWSAYVYKNYETEKEKIGLMHNYVLLFVILAVSALVLFRDPIYIFIGSGFHSSKHFFSLILMMPVLNIVSETTSKGIDIAKKNEYTLLSFIICIATNIGLCLLLIPTLGLAGAAWSNAISAIVLYILNSYFGQRYYKTILSLKKSLLGILAIIILLSLPSFTLDMLLIAVVVIAVDICILFIFRNEATVIYGKIQATISFWKHKHK